MNSARDHNFLRKQGFDLWGFFAISHGWSWAFWSIPVINGGNAWDYPNLLFIYLGGLGPPLAAILMTYLTMDRPALAELLLRVVDVRRIAPRWYAPIFLLVPLVTLTAIVLGVLTGVPAETIKAGAVSELPTLPSELISFVIFTFLFGPLPEEIGWRGYALDRLQKRWSAITASVILGVAWGAWHIPLFFMSGYYGTDGSPDPLLFFYNITLASILLTWIYNNNHRSVLAPALFHFMINFTGSVVSIPLSVDIYKACIMTGVVLFVILFWHPGTLRKDDKITSENQDTDA